MTTAASSYTSTSPSQISPAVGAAHHPKISHCVHELAGTIDCLAHTSLKASMICWLKERMWMMHALSLVN